jgi:uncharacterized membrane protein YkvI
MKNAFKIIFVIIGTIIGAGFASGKEILIFFNTYGTEGFIGVAISSILISIVIFMVLNICLNKKINSYEEFVETTIVKNKTIKNIINGVINIFLFISFCIMMAAFIAYFVQELQIENKGVIAILLGITVYIILLKDINGIIKVNAILMPILIILIIILGIKNSIKIEGMEVLQTANVMKNWIISAVIYASYNSIVLIPILLTIRSFIKNKKEIKVISISCGIIFFILAAIIYFLISTKINEVKEMEMPVVYIASQNGSLYKYIYGGVILRRDFNNCYIYWIWLFKEYYKTTKNI